mmetsp:Transcript_82749/g.246870  ORF Transcript_82749/g.246870 Transcript_82749/m.246870 type:complete len:480 (-) Transcript_82749:115-1554(-)
MLSPPATFCSGGALCSPEPPPSMAALRCGRSLLLLLLHALLACKAEPPAVPTLLSSPAGIDDVDDPWSRFAAEWSPEVRAKIAALKAEVQKATAAADAAWSAAWAAKREVAEAKQKEAEEAKLLAEVEAERERKQDAPQAKAARARIERVVRCWQAAAGLLAGVVLCGIAYGQLRGAWVLKPLNWSEPLLPSKGGWADAKLKGELAQAHAQAEPGAADAEPRKCQARPPQDAAWARDWEAPAKRAAWDVLLGRARKAGAEESAGKAEAQEAEAQESTSARLLRELQARAGAEVSEARAREAAAREELADVQAKAKADLARAQSEEAAARKAAQEMREELRRLRAGFAGPLQGCPSPSAEEPERSLDLRPRVVSPTVVRPVPPPSPAVAAPPPSPTRPLTTARAASPTGLIMPPVLPEMPPLFAFNPSQFLAAPFPQLQPLPGSAGCGQEALPPSRVHLVAEPASCPAEPGGFRVSGPTS